VWALLDLSELSVGLPSEFLLSIGPCACLVAISQVLQSWFAAEGWYRDLSLLRIFQAVTIATSQLSLSIFSPSSQSLILAYLLGVLIAVTAGLHAHPLPRVSRARVRVSIRRIWDRHRRFVTYSLPADSLNTAASNLPAIFVASRFGAEPAGYLAMAMTMLGAPIGLLGKSVLDVFKRHASQSFLLRGECVNEYRQTFLVLASGSFITLVVALPTLDGLVRLLLGSEWADTSFIAKLLLPLFLLRFIASPLSYMVYVAGRQDLDLVWQSVLFLLILISLNLPLTLESAMITYSAGYSLMYCLYLILSYRLSKGRLA
jgi:O-antigen/teichoic acid export membrane protein